jgi:hypothetical protein
MGNTKYGVFIIESLTLENEKDKRLDGFILKQILDLCEIKNEYYYLRTDLELKKIIRLFETSGLRYLHLSCHGSNNEISLTFKNLSFTALSKIIGPYIKNRRVFISACKSSNKELAKEFSIEDHYYSVIGSPVKIGFDQSAVFWSGFYQRMNEINDSTMKKEDLLDLIEKLSNAYNLPVNYYSFIRNSDKSFNSKKFYEYLIKPDAITEKSTIVINTKA